MNKEQLETKEFQAETKQLLDLMVNSIYTNQEIFVRELVANASDAIDKVKFKSLSEREKLDDTSDFEILIDVNEENKTFTISDNGIGMSYDEVIENIGTIAESGTKKFLAKLKKDKENIDLIGQFGVGFYSSFMVADKVTLTTKAPGDNKAVRWESSGDGTYTIEYTEKEKRGTTVELKLREEFISAGDGDYDFTDPHTIKNLVSKYSNYVRYPIMMELPKTEASEADEEPKTTTEIETLNAMTPIWKRDKSEISEQDYADFYKNNFNDWQEPMEVMHWSAEGRIKFTGLLFIPETAPRDFYSADFEPGLKLYSRDNFIMDKCQEILPDYLNFVRGLFDSPDFSLNISREILQHNRQLKTIAKNAEKVVLRKLKKLLNNSREQYEEFWQEFGMAIKGGIYSNRSNKDKLEDLLLFNSSHNKEEMTTLAEHVERMSDEQNVIYYATGEKPATIEKLPQLELLFEKELEVLYLLDEIDEFVINNLGDYNDIEFKSALREDLDLDDDSSEKDETDNEDEEIKEELLAKIEENLAGKVDEVKLSKRLKSSAVCLVSGEQGMSMSMEKVFKQMNQNLGQAQRILEINPDHKLYSRLKEIYATDPNSEQLKEYSELLYTLSSMVEGFTPNDPVEFSSKITKLMADK